MEKLTYDWNLKDLYETEQDALSAFEKYKRLKTEIVEFKGKLNNEENIKKYLNKSVELSKLEERLGSYLFLRRELNGKDVFALKMLGDVAHFDTTINPKLAFVNDELLQNGDKFLLDLANKKDFKDFDIALKDLVENKSHVLKEEIQSVINMNPAFGMASDVFDSFDDIDLKFKPVKTKNGTQKLTHATYSRFLQDPDQNVRMQAHNNTHKAYADFNYTLSGLYLNDVKETLFFSKLRKYNSVFENASSGDKSTIKVLETLIETVHNNLPLFYRNEELAKKALGLKKFYYFDNYAQIGSCSKKFDYAKSAQTVYDVLSVMGEEYRAHIKEALTNGWIDVYEKPAKRSGGFNLGVYGVHPYILLNHEDNYNAMSTLIHELGHAMHSVYSDSHQPITKSSASIFAAEVASIVNEVILAKYMIAHSTKREEKLYYIHTLLHSFYTTVFRQTMFAEFEHYVYKSNEMGKTLVVDDLNNEYERLQALYFGSGAHKTPYSKYEWSRIPHFYRPYYVYKYATGFISACTIAENILKGDKNYLKKYIAFLSAGSSIEPLKLLKTLDVDLENPATLQGAFDLYQELLNQFEKLI